jgi:hypothetical protein
MKTFVLTNEHIPGEIFLLEDDCGKVRCDFSKSDATAPQQTFILQHAESGMAELKRVLTGNSKLVELLATFEMFWRRYDDKLNSSKKRSEIKWNKMSKVEQQRAYDFIPTYFNNIPYGTRRKFAETYLNAELWNN